MTRVRGTRTDWSSRILGQSVAAGLLALALGVPVLAQEPVNSAGKSAAAGTQAGNPADEPSAADVEDVDSTAPLRGRLPNYFGKLGISDQQRRRIYSIQAGTRSKIELLEEQIERLRKAESQEVEQVLTVEQRELLEEMRAEARKRREQRETTSRD